MTITARYPSRCARCHQPIAPGTPIEWNRTTPTTHAGACPKSALQYASEVVGVSLPDTYGRPAPRFTCRRCGEHRDTTLQGHCDDCEG